jgi:Beta-lactamase class C and other penicillin bindi ng proteins
MENNAAVLGLLQTQIAAGRQIGVQVAAYLHGQKIIDVVAGTMGPNDERPVEGDSLFLSFSATKGPSALVVHQLADRGVIDYSAPVAEYWPEFARNGKSAITVAQAMSHQAGLYAMPPEFRPEHLTDWDAALEWVAGGTPAWEPGTATGYHAVTYGWLVGGIVRGATGRHFSDVVRTEVAEPLGVADEFFVGIPDEPAVVKRLTTLEIVAAGDGLPVPDDSPFYEAMPKAMWPHFNSMEMRTACMPGANGHFTARALARMYGALANGGTIDGVTLVSPQRIAAMQKLQTAEVDRVLGAAIRKNTGFFLGGLGPDLSGRSVHGPVGPRETAFGHSGAGGSVGFADPELGLGVAVTLNKMTYPNPGEGVTLEICDLVRSLL